MTSVEVISSAMVSSKSWGKKMLLSITNLNRLMSTELHRARRNTTLSKDEDNKQEDEFPVFAHIKNMAYILCNL